MCIRSKRILCFLRNLVYPRPSFRVEVPWGEGLGISFSLVTWELLRFCGRRLLFWELDWFPAVRTVIYKLFWAPVTLSPRARFNVTALSPKERNKSKGRNPEPDPLRLSRCFLWFWYCVFEFLPILSLSHISYQLGAFSPTNPLYLAPFFLCLTGSRVVNICVLFIIGFTNTDILFVNLSSKIKYICI